MALSAVATYRDITRRKKHIDVLVTPSGNYVSGGDIFNLTAITNPKLLSGVKPATLPQVGIVLNAPGGYYAEFIMGTTMTNCKLKVYTSGGAELAAAAYPAALLANAFLVRLTGNLGAF